MSGHSPKPHNSTSPPPGGEKNRELKQDQGQEATEPLLCSNEECIWCTEDVVWHVFTFLSACELGNCMNVCLVWKNVVFHDNSLWKVHCSFAFPKILNLLRARAARIRSHSHAPALQTSSSSSSASLLSELGISKKYNNLLYKYFKQHKKVRFDGTYITHIMYYIESEPSMLAIEKPKQYKMKPYQKIEYFRYVRFFAPKRRSEIFASTVAFNKNIAKRRNAAKMQSTAHGSASTGPTASAAKKTGGAGVRKDGEGLHGEIFLNLNGMEPHEEGLESNRQFNELMTCENEDIVYPVIYSCSKDGPAQFQLFAHFAANADEGRFLNRMFNNNKDHCLELKSKHHGIVKEDKIFLGKYNIINEKNEKTERNERSEKSEKEGKRYVIDVNTDYGVKLVMALKVQETVKGRADRLQMCQFDRYSIDKQTKEIIREGYNSKVRMECRHEPFIFVPDTMFQYANEYFE